MSKQQIAEELNIAKHCADRRWNIVYVAWIYHTNLRRHAGDYSITVLALMMLHVSIDMYVRNTSSLAPTPPLCPIPIAFLTPSLLTAPRTLSKALVLMKAWIGYHLLSQTSKNESEVDVTSLLLTSGSLISAGWLFSLFFSCTTVSHSSSGALNRIGTQRLNM